jgi:FixJ family two-component response regulator
MTPKRATVYVVDDNVRMLRALRLLLHAHGYLVRTYESAAAFVEDYDPGIPGCVISDLSMPGLDGIALQRELNARGGHRPVIFLSGQSSVPESVQAMKEGAVDFLTKPVDEAVLLQAVASAIARDAEMHEMNRRIATLTERERGVMERLAAGDLNKQIAADYGVAERTIKFHRGNLMRKLGITSPALLGRFAVQARLVPATAPLPADSWAK